MNQQGSTWMVQAQDMELTVTIHLFGKTWRPQIEPEQMSLLNPVFLSFILPILEYTLRNAQAKTQNEEEQEQKEEGEYEQQENNNNNCNIDTMNDIQPFTTVLQNDTTSDFNNNTLQSSPTTLQTDLLPPTTTTTTSSPLSSSSQSFSKSKNNNNMNKSNITTNNTTTIKAASVATSPLNKLIAGMFCAALAYICAATVDHFITQYKTDNNGKLSILWQTPQYFFVTVAEVLISVTG
eukprot:UN04787